jgi:hypothetical protein
MKVRPAPINTMAATAGSAAALWMADRIPSGTPGLRAFTGGLEIVMTATPSCRLDRATSFMNVASLPTGR